MGNILDLTVTDYNGMSQNDKMKVDEIVDRYKSGTNDGISTEALENFINSRLNTDTMRKINEKVDENETINNRLQNDLRETLFKDRVKNGYYSQGCTPSDTTPKHIPNSDEITKEISNIKEDINALKELIINNIVNK